MNKKQVEVAEGFNYYETIRQLHTADLVIRTIPGEEWVLTCARHKTLLVDVYTLTGKIANTKRTRTYICGRLSEILLKLLYVGRRVQVHHHQTTEKESGIISLHRTHIMLAETVEEDFMIRLQNGDLIFHATSELWRLTNTCFGKLMGNPVIFYLAEERTLGTPDPHIYKGIELEQVLLQFLCQNSAFVEREHTGKVLDFKVKELEWTDRR